MLFPVSALAAFAYSLRPPLDPDVYWHVRVGADILRRHSVYGAGSGWTILPPAHTWTSPEWLSDLTLRGFVNAFGWQGDLVFQVVVSILFLTALAAATLRAGDVRAAALTYAAVAMSLSPYLQPRPQTISFVALVAVAAWSRSVLVERRLPRALTFLPLTLIWAQFHGLWLLGPVVLAIASALCLLDDRSPSARRFVLRGIGLAVAGLAVGCVNPLGLRSLTLPLRLKASTATIVEWQPTTFHSFLSWGLLLVVAAMVIAWARSGDRVARSETGFVLLVFAFSLLALRNVGPALILITPLAVTRFSRGLTAVPDRAASSRLIYPALGGLTVLTLAVAGVGAATVRPFPSYLPLRLIAALDDGSPHRVLDDYNLGGAILVLGGPDLRVAVDGRADYFGGAYLADYARLMQMDRGWLRLFHRLDPDTALIQSALPLREYLLHHGWNDQGSQGKFVLLARNTHG